MRVVHEGGADGGRRVLASEVETADTFGEQAKGLMGRDSLPEDYAMVFRFEDPPGWMPDPLTHWRSIHMLFVGLPLDVLWVLDETVQQSKTVSPWTGVGVGRADTVVELPAGAGSDVEVGDRIRIED